MTERVLTEQQVADFHRDGFLVVRGMYSAQDVTDIDHWTDDVAGSPEIPGKYMMYFEPGPGGDKTRIISRIENFIPFWTVA